jgi:hypothetical protein
MAAVVMVVELQLAQQEARILVVAVVAEVTVPRQLIMLVAMEPAV